MSLVPPHLLTRLVWAGAAILAAVVAAGLLVSVATIALAGPLGLLSALGIVASALTAIAGVCIYLARRPARLPETAGLPAAGAEDEEDPSAAVMALALDLIQRKPLWALGLFGALGFAVARRPGDMAEIGRGAARLFER